MPHAHGEFDGVIRSQIFLLPVEETFAQGNLETQNRIVMTPSSTATDPLPPLSSTFCY